MRLLTLATVFAAASGYIVIAIASRALGAGGVDAFQAFWSLFFALAGVANGLMQELTRAVRSARVGATEVGADDELAGPAGTDGRAPSGAAGNDPVLGGIELGAALARPAGTGLRPSLARRSLLWTGLAVGLVLAALVALSGPAWSTLGLDAHGGAAVAVLAVGICGFALQAAVAGSLSGTERWNLYAMLIAVDAALRLVVALASWALGVPHLSFELTTVVGTLTWIIMIATIPAVRSALRSPLDVPARRFWISTVQAMLASAGTSIMVTGFPLLVTATAGPADDRVLVGATINAILLTRAPLLVPLTSFQSAIIVWFVERRDSGIRALLIPLSAVIGIGVVGALAAWLVADPLVRLVFGQEFGLPGAVFAGLTAASIGTAALMISGNAALAFDRHAIYNAGWWVAVGGSVALLLVLPFELDVRATIALLAGPAAGAVVHVVGVLGARGPAGSAGSAGSIDQAAPVPEASTAATGGDL